MKLPAWVIVQLAFFICSIDGSTSPAPTVSSRYSTIRSALMDLYTTTGGAGTMALLRLPAPGAHYLAGWVSQVGWSSNQTYCDWAQVACAAGSTVEVEHLYSAPLGSQYLRSDCALQESRKQFLVWNYSYQSCTPNGSQDAGAVGQHTLGHSCHQRIFTADRPADPDLRFRCER